MLPQGVDLMGFLQSKACREGCAQMQPLRVTQSIFLFIVATGPYGELLILLPVLYSRKRTPQ
jgi:hypothetical protein